MADIDATERLAEFFRRCVWESWQGLDVDGGDIQDWGVELGLLMKVPYDPEKHGRAGLEDDMEPGDNWYVLSDGVLALVNDYQQLIARSSPTHGS